MLPSHSSCNFPKVLHKPHSPQPAPHPAREEENQAPLSPFCPCFAYLKPLIVLHLKLLPGLRSPIPQDAGEHRAVPPSLPAPECPNMVPHCSSVARHYFIPRICNTPIYTSQWMFAIPGPRGVIPPAEPECCDAPGLVFLSALHPPHPGTCICSLPPSSAAPSFRSFLQFMISIRSPAMLGCLSAPLPLQIPRQTNHVCLSDSVLPPFMEYLVSTALENSFRIIPVTLNSYSLNIL